MPEASCCFLHVFGFRNPLKEILSEWAENPRRSVFTRNEDRDRRRPGGGLGGSQRTPRARVSPRPRLVGPWAPLPPPPVASSPIRCPKPKKVRGRSYFPRNIQRGAVTSKVQSRAFAALFRYPAGGRDHRWRPLHHHDCLHDDA